MIVSMLSQADVTERAVRALGLDPNIVDLLATEGLCAALRRAASFLCPATPKQLVDAVLEVLQPLGLTITRDTLNDLIDLLIASGDLLEVSEAMDHASRQLYLGPPSFVTKSQGHYLLLGIRPFGVPIIDDTLLDVLDYEGHMRSVELDPVGAETTLAELGLREIRRDHWLRHPPVLSAADMVDTFAARLAAAPMTGSVDGLTVLDTALPVRYYRGRWRTPRVKDSGRFVARRAQAYGADIWCVVRLDAGAPRALVDLPVGDHEQPGRFQAWHLQAALDAVAGHRQRYRLRPAVGTAGNQVLDLFSPLPGWAERYLELAGMPVNRSTSALMSFRLPATAVAEVEEFLAAMLWMTPVEDGGSQ